MTKKKNTPALMVTGTCSDAGKSIVATALLRIAYHRGIKVSPFKAQNMALNSYVTIDNREIGRSQAVQAIAAHVDETWRINPILLKPVSENRSQVIVKGKPIGNMSTKAYYNYKEKAFEAVKKAYDDLSAEFDLVIMEGAGSPAEINLWDKDIVNMPMAEYARAKTVLVGDIERGGVFASIFGTLGLFPEKWISMTIGFIINRLRGDVKLLYPGIKILEEKTGKKCFGVIPYYKGIGIPDEDSLSLDRRDQSVTHSAKLSIGVIRLPHISNFSDFNAFRFEEEIHLEMIEPHEPFDHFDILIIPGTKNTIQDYTESFINGTKERIRSFRGTLVGICGGMQMMGMEISDPNQVEASHSNTIQCLGLLPIKTVMQKQKILSRVTTKDPFFKEEVSGYEIHHGHSKNGELFIGKPNCFGTYLHGIFDFDRFRHAFLNDVYRRKTGKLYRFSGKYDLDKQIDDFSEFVEKNIDCDNLFKQVGF